MTFTSKYVIGVVIVIAILLGAGTVAQRSRTPEVIKIGVIAPLTGNVAFLGEGIRNAVAMAEQEIQGSDTKRSYEIILEDDAFNVQKSASAAQKLISIDKVSALVTLASAAGNVVNPIAEQNHIVHFGIASDPTVAKGNFNFIHWTPPYEETKVFVPQLQKRGYHRVAILGANIQGVTAVIDSFEKDIQNTDIQVVSKQIFEFGTTDFRTMLAKAESARPDIYMLEAFSPELDLITKQMKVVGITKPITAIESFEQSDHPEIFEGSWYVNAADTTNEFNTKYESSYGKSPTLGAGNAYDIVHLIVSAAENVDTSKKPTSEQIAEQLYKIKGQKGALGELSIDGDGFVISKAVVRMIKDGKPVTIVP